MTILISIGRKKEEIWTIQSWIYRWLVRLIENKYPNEKDVIEDLKMGEIFNGTSLDLTAKDNLELAKKTSTIVKETALEIASGKHVLVDDDGNPDPDSQEQVERLFAKLAKMLEVTDTW